MGVGQARGPERATVATNSSKENFRDCPGQGELLVFVPELQHQTAEWERALF